jgi:hypothetical protein
VYIYFNKVKNFVYVEFMKPPAWFISDIKLKVLGWILAEPGPYGVSFCLLTCHLMMEVETTSDILWFGKLSG